MTQSMGTLLNGSHAGSSKGVARMGIQSGGLETAAGDGTPVFCAAGARAVGEFHCAECGYGVTVRQQLPRCPMCGGDAWEPAGTSSHAPVFSA